MGKKKKKRTHIPFRLNILFFVVFCLFSVLILRLGFVQIVYGGEYQREIDQTDEVNINNTVPRGKILDRYANVVVDNVPLNAITYTRQPGETVQDLLEKARELSKYITMEKEQLDRVTERDRQDFWMVTRPDKALELVSKEEIAKLENDEVYQRQLDRVPTEEIENFSDEEMQVLAIWRAMNSGYQLTPQMIKNRGVTDKEFAVVSEHLSELPGVGVTTDWNRYRVYGSTLSSVLGGVSSAEEGLPRDRIQYFLSRGYSRNDRVGTSYIEEEYEEILYGTKGKVRNITNRQGDVIESIVLQEGKRGKDLLLSIDMELQIAVEKIIEEELRAAKQESIDTKYLDRAFVTLLDPFTGEVLTMAGKQYARNDETGELEMNDFALGNMTTSYVVGSSVKGATVLTGYEQGVISAGNTNKVDEILYIQGSEPIRSVSVMGNIDDITALRRSSNVYMVKTAIEIGGDRYIRNDALNLSLSSTFDIFRNTFSQFGLGVRTGIDLPGEATGYAGSETTQGLLFYSFGQYDTYTPLQLAQYVSTIANGGYRMQPRIVKQIREPLEVPNRLGPVIEDMEPRILNKLTMDQPVIERVQEGFRQVMQEPRGTGVRYFGDKDYLPAGKTGTAETFYYDASAGRSFETSNLSLVAYAPYDRPEIAMSVVVPAAYQGSSGNGLNMKIGERVLDTYFALKEERGNMTGALNEVGNYEEAQQEQEQIREANEEGNLEEVEENLDNENEENPEGTEEQQDGQEARLEEDDEE